MSDDGRYPGLARVGAFLLLAWTLLLSVRVVVAVMRGDWMLGLVGVGVLAGSAGMTAWAWSAARR